MIPDLILNVNGTDITIPGVTGIVVGSILYMLLGLLVAGRSHFGKKVASDSRPCRADVAEYTFQALIVSVFWPVIGGFKLIMKITRPLLMSKASKEKLDKFL